MIIVDKPVIYLYSENERNVSVKLKAKGDLTFTYPTISSEDSWKVKLGKNGLIQTDDGGEYSYLFWEAKQEQSTFTSILPNSAQLLCGSELVPYFEKELNNLGLNAREKTDFITFWCPKLINKDQILVQFYLDEKCELIGELQIDPKHKNVRRVYVTFQEINAERKDFKNIELHPSPFLRDDFTVLEWGGSILNQSDL